MNDIMVDEFQYTVQELLIRNKSLLDQITKFQDSNARVNRSIVKAITHCGCVEVTARKQELPEDAEFEQLRDSMDTHLSGTLCDSCRDIIEKEIGRNLFYLASICNTLDMNLYDIIIKENERVKLLGKFNLR
jgi:hypothetical protein